MAIQYHLKQNILYVKIFSFHMICLIFNIHMCTISSKSDTLQVVIIFTVTKQNFQQNQSGNPQILCYEFIYNKVKIYNMTKIT